MTGTNGGAPTGKGPPAAKATRSSRRRRSPRRRCEKRTGALPDRQSNADAAPAAASCEPPAEGPGHPARTRSQTQRQGSRGKSAPRADARPARTRHTGRPEGPAARMLLAQGLRKASATSTSLLPRTRTRRTDLHSPECRSCRMRKPLEPGTAGPRLSPWNERSRLAARLGGYRLREESGHRARVTASGVKRPRTRPAAAGNPPEPRQRAAALLTHSGGSARYRARPGFGESKVRSTIED